MIYAHKVKGAWWAADELSHPRMFENVDALLEYAGSSPVGVIGSSEMAADIVTLYERHAIRLATPMAIHGVEARPSRGEATVWALRQWQLASSLGGWNTPRDVDIIPYRAAAKQPIDATRHPVWRHWSFIDGFSPQHGEWVLRHLLDPRWYVDPQAPGRTARAVRRLRNGESNLRACWTGKGLSNSPRSFVAQRAFTADDPRAADLLCARFLVLTWRAELPASVGADALFDPLQLLPANVAAAYRLHIEQGAGDGANNAVCDASAGVAAIATD